MPDARCPRQRGARDSGGGAAQAHRPSTARESARSARRAPRSSALMEPQAQHATDPPFSRTRTAPIPKPSRTEPRRTRRRRRTAPRRSRLLRRTARRGARRSANCAPVDLAIPIRVPSVTGSASARRSWCSRSGGKGVPRWSMSAPGATRPGRCDGPYRTGAQGMRCGQARGCHGRQRDRRRIRTVRSRATDLRSDQHEQPHRDGTPAPLTSRNQDDGASLLGLTPSG